MILLLAYSAVLLSLASGLLALLLNQRQAIIELSQYPFKKLSIAAYLEERQFPTLLRRAVFVLLGLSAIFAVLAGLSVLISNTVVTDQISLGLPWLPWHVRFDGLSGFFFLIVGIAVFAVSLYGPGYMNGYDANQHPFAVLSLFSGLFVAGMLLVLLADDAFFFMIAWELMSVASYFLVAFQHENSAQSPRRFFVFVNGWSWCLGHYSRLWRVGQFI